MSANSMAAPDRGTPPAPAPLRNFDFPEFTRIRLENGLRVLHAPIHALPVVTLNLLVEVGATADSPGRAGTASMVANLLESGTERAGPAEIAETFEHLGMELDAGAGWSHTHIGATGLASNVGPAADMMTALVRAPAFPPGEVERIRAELRANRMQRRAEPRALANEMAARFIFHGESPFSRPISGTPESLEAVTRDDIERLHGEGFVPSRSTLVVVGDVKADAARRLAERCFGDWSGRGVSVADPSASPRSNEPRVVIVHRTGAVQSEIRVGHVGVARSTPDYFELLVMNAILGGSFSSRLNMNLRERHGFTYGASSGFALRRHPGPFMASTAVQSEVTAPALREILNEMSGIRSAEPDAAELRNARDYLAGVFPLRLQSTGGVARRLSELALHRLDDDYYDRYRDHILRVDAPGVHRVAREHLHPRSSVVVVVGDADAVREPLEALGHAPVEVIDAEGGDPE